MAGEEEVPQPMTHPLLSDIPGEPILLYSGSADLIQDEKTIPADIAILLDWLPSPRLKVIVPSANVRLGDTAIHLSDGTVIEHAFISSLRPVPVPNGFVQRSTGRLGQRVIRGQDAKATHALFLLPNVKAPSSAAVATGRGWRSARSTLVGGGWRFTLDEVESVKDVLTFLSERSGFAVTHVGRMERDDASSFTAEDAVRALNAFSWFVSFACGRWTGPFLPHGYGDESRLVWEIWDLPRSARFESRRTWMDTIHHRTFEGPFAGFMKLWGDDDWQEVIRLAIHWFIEANAMAGSIEGSIVLTQTAFELLSSAVLVERHGWLSTDGYEKIAAADRIRLLFKWAGIPTVIPADLDGLVKLAAKDNWPDSPTAMTMIRNTITHPTRKNRAKFGSHTGDARADAWTLGLWCLELCILRLCDYRGQFSCRITQAYVGEVVPVPWASSDPIGS